MTLIDDNEGMVVAISDLLKIRTECGKDIPFRIDVLNEAISSTFPLEDLLGYDSHEEQVYGGSVASFLGSLIHQQGLFFTLTGVALDSGILAVRKGQTLNDVLKNKFDLGVRANIPHVDMDVGLLTSYIDSTKEDPGSSTKHTAPLIARKRGKFTRFYYHTPSIINPLTEELTTKTIDTCLGVITYKDFLATVLAVERQHIAYTNYNSLMWLGEGLFQRQNYAEAIVFFADIVNHYPGFFNSGALRLPDKEDGELQTWIDGYRRLEKYSSDTLEQREELLGKIIRFCLNDFKTPGFRGLDDFADMFCVDRKDMVLRASRLNAASEIELTDLGPIQQTLNVLKQLKVDIDLSHRNYDNGWTALKDFNCFRLLDDLKYLGMYHFVIEDKSIETFLVLNNLVSEPESARKVFGLTTQPSVVGDEQGSFANFVLRRSKRYRSKSPKIPKPFHIEREGQTYHGYTPSDLERGDEEDCTTIPHFLDSSGAYSPIKLELVIREIVETGEIEEQTDLLELDQVASYLGCVSDVAEEILKAQKVRNQFTVLSDAHRRINEDQFVNGFDTYESVLTFYRRHLQREQDLRSSVDGSLKYSGEDVHALKQRVFVTPTQFGLDLDLDFPVDNTLISRVNGKKTRLMAFSIDGEEMYYRPDVDEAVKTLRDGNFCRNAFIYHSVQEEFSQREDQT